MQLYGKPHLHNATINILKESVDISLVYTYLQVSSSSPRYLKYLRYLSPPELSLPGLSSPITPFSSSPHLSLLSLTHSSFSPSISSPIGGGGLPRGGAAMLSSPWNHISTLWMLSHLSLSLGVMSVRDGRWRHGWLLDWSRLSCPRTEGSWSSCPRG